MGIFQLLKNRRNSWKTVEINVVKGFPNTWEFAEHLFCLDTESLKKRSYNKARQPSEDLKKKNKNTTPKNYRRNALGYS